MSFHVQSTASHPSRAIFNLTAPHRPMTLTYTSTYSCTPLVQVQLLPPSLTSHGSYLLPSLDMVSFYFPSGIPGLTNPAALGALFSLTATGLYTSYLIPVLLRVTVSRSSFKSAEFNLGKYSVPMGTVAVTWATFMIIVLCLPQDAPITINNMNYSPIALGIVLISAFLSWIISARHWFKGR